MSERSRRATDPAWVRRMQREATSAIRSWVSAATWENERRPGTKCRIELEITSRATGMHEPDDDKVIELRVAHRAETPPTLLINSLGKRK